MIRFGRKRTMILLWLISSMTVKEGLAVVGRKRGGRGIAATLVELRTMAGRGGRMR